ncbi:MAG: DNA polymerase III subunit gamma/tau [Proteobacteria bacterium]|nr:DNA polymerase III subunit gamma/tau [Pseudomonadota bacterium]
MAEAKPAQESVSASGGGYVVLARRHRPTRFEQVIGQQHVTRTLQNAIRVGRVHHAYLFTGSRGVGKTTVARILARALNQPGGPTPDPPASADPEQEARFAVDVIEIDGASHTGVDDVRELREAVRYLPAHSRHKIYIIDEVHMLSTSAFNALLKTLEEPPPHVVFVFATTEPHKIPATILSRCQRFDFKRVPTALLVEHLQHLLTQEQLVGDPGALGLIARAAEGGVRDALSLLDQVIAYAAGRDRIDAALVAEVLGVADRRVLFTLSAALLARDAAAALSVVDRLFADGHDLARAAQDFVGHLRDLVVVRTCADPGALVEATEAELTELRAQGAAVAPPQLQQLFERSVRAAEQIARSSFPRLQLEMALIEMAEAVPMLPLGELVERLEAMERRLGAAGAAAAPAPSGGAGGRPSSAGARPAPKRRAAAPSAAEPDPVGASASTARVPTRPRTIEEASTVAAEASPAPSAAAPPAGGAGSAGEEAEGPSEQDSAGDEPPAWLVAPPLERWRALLRQLDGPAVGVFSCGRLLGWHERRIELGYPAGSFELQRAEKRERCSSFAGLCAAKLGYEVELRVRALRPEEQGSPQLAQQSAVEVQEQEARERARRLTDEAIDHPATRALVARFGATVKSVSTGPEGVES